MALCPAQDPEPWAKETFSRAQRRDRMSQGDGSGRAGLGWTRLGGAGRGRAGRTLETPCLFWELFRTLRFWKARAAQSQLLLL